MKTAPPRQAPSKVDDAERSLREWLVPGRFRVGDRLPPEHDLAELLNVSRGTLRAALARMEQSGVIRRRRGSGTFVEHPVGSDGRGFSAGLEVLESYSLLAERAALRLGSRDLTVRRAALPGAAREALGLPDGARGLTIERVLLVDARPAAWMSDTLPGDLDVPPNAEIRAGLEGGRMLLDVLRAAGIPMAYARTEVGTRLVTPEQRIGRALELREATALLELTETMHLSDGTPVQWSVNLFRPNSLKVHVMRALPPGPPPQLGEGRAAGRQPD